jgi:hypothetical protein
MRAVASNDKDSCEDWRVKGAGDKDNDNDKDSDRGATSGARVCTCYAVPVVFAADICELMTSSMNAARDGEKQHRRQEEEHSKGLEKAWRCRHLVTLAS